MSVCFVNGTVPFILYITAQCLVLCGQLIVDARSDNSRPGLSQRESAFREVNVHVNKIDDRIHGNRKDKSYVKAASL